MALNNSGVDAAARLIALRDHWRALAQSMAHGTYEEYLRARAYEDDADDLDELITALLRPQREAEEEDPTDDPRNRASVVRSETEPTRSNRNEARSDDRDV